VRLELALGLIAPDARERRMKTPKATTQPFATASSVAVSAAAVAAALVLVLAAQQKIGVRAAPVPEPLGL